MKKTIITFSILMSILSYSENNYYSIISNEHNKFTEGEIVAPPSPDSNVCSIEFTNISSSLFATFAEMRINTVDGYYDFGELISRDGRTDAYFENATVKASDTYNNNYYYYAEYAIRGYENPASHHSTYWLPGVNDASYQIILLNPVNMVSLEYTDWGRTNHYTESHTVTVYDCEGEILKTENYSQTLATEYRDIITFTLD